METIDIRDFEGLARSLTLTGSAQAACIFGDRLWLSKLPIEALDILEINKL
jgi:hypothetical protein